MPGLGSYAFLGAVSGAAGGLMERARTLREQQRSTFRTLSADESKNRGLDPNGVYQVSGDGRLNVVQGARTPKQPSIRLYGPNGGTQEVASGSQEEKRFTELGYSPMKPKAAATAGKWVDIFLPNGKSRRVQEGTDEHARLVADGGTGTAPKSGSGGEMKPKDYATVVNQARDDATAKGLDGNKAVDYRAWAENIMAYGVTPKPATVAIIKRGIEKQIGEQVKADAEGRKEWLKSRDEEFSGKTEAEWIREETDNRVNAELTAIGLVQGASRGGGDQKSVQVGLFEKAQDALSKGADPMAVMKKFQELGLDYTEFEKWQGGKDPAAADRELDKALR